MIKLRVKKMEGKRAKKKERGKQRIRNNKKEERIFMPLFEGHKKDNYNQKRI